MAMELMMMELMMMMMMMISWKSSEMMSKMMLLGRWNKIRVSGRRDVEGGHPAGRPFVVKWPKQSKCPQIVKCW